MSWESVMDNVLHFPEREAEWGICPECGGMNWKLEVDGTPWDRILRLECAHCPYIMEEQFSLDVEVAVELEP